MGSNGGYFSSEAPVHPVTISRAFYMQKSEVTQGQWRAVMGNNPSYFSTCGDVCPVERVSWDDVQGFLQQLNTMTSGVTYRLPTEAEWEYAARAGTTTEDYAPIDSIAWYGANASGMTHAVGGKRANAWNLFDMIGNVFEWVSDWHDTYSEAATTDPMGPASGSERVQRGGSWYNSGISARAAFRYANSPSVRFANLGFRLVRVPTASAAAVGSVSVTPSTGSLSTGTAGQTFQLTATTLDANGNVITGCAVAWSTSNAAVATVSESGLVAAVAVGSAIITATCEGKSGTATITVSAPSFELTVTGAGTGNGTIAAPAAGGQAALSATSTAGVMSGTTRQSYPSGTDVTLTAAAANGSSFAGWSGDVCSGAGACAVTMSQARSVTATFNLAPVPVATVTVDPAAATISVAGTVTVTATARDASANVLSGRAFTWTTSNQGIVSGTASGNVATVRGVAVGSATITATSEGKSGGAAITVTGSQQNSTLAIYPGQAISGVIDSARTYSCLFAQTALATGGSIISGYSWTITPGRVQPFPTLTITPLQGVISLCSPTLKLGTYTMYIDVRDDAGTTRSGQVTINLTRTCNSANINNPCMELLVQNGHSDYLPAGKVGQDYAASIYTTGGVPPYSWKLASGNLPPGIVIDAARGVLRGSPTKDGTYLFYVRTTDSVGNSSDLMLSDPYNQFRLVINP